MKLTFFGAAGEVTGSCYLLETSRARILVDFGLHQGGREIEARNRTLPRFDASRLDAVVLTHAHIDHAGRLPLLPGAGFKGAIHATPATIDLCGILLPDAAYLQVNDAQRRSERLLRAGFPPVPPLYGARDVEQALAMFAPLPYEVPREVAPGITARLVDAGHIIGSASVELTVRENGRSIVLAFSGDLGGSGMPLLRDPTALTHADVVILESTYGDRDHRTRGSTLDELTGILLEAHAERDGRVIIPAFAVGRTQQLIYELGRLRREGRIPAECAVYIDSPMAIEATDLYTKYRDLFDEAAREFIAAGGSPLAFAGLKYARTVEQSKALNTLGAGSIIISASGMCNGGRILHHLRNALWRPQCHVVVVGFQAHGTLGRRLVDGAKVVRIMNEAIAVKAQIHTLGGFSAHTGQTGLVAWARNVSPKPGRLFLTHGEDAPRAALAMKLRAEAQVDAALPAWGETVQI